MQLKDKRCVPCEGGMPTVDEAGVKMLLGELHGWENRLGVDHVPKIAKRYRFDDFLTAMAFVDKMAALAEEEGHHPDFCVHYSQVDVTLWTHAVNGLSENDFILAAKLDELLS